MKNNFSKTILLTFFYGLLIGGTLYSGKSQTATPLKLTTPQDTVVDTSFYSVWDTIFSMEEELYSEKAQTTTLLKLTIPQCTIVDTSFYSVLDSIISLQKQCNAFHDSLVFLCYIVPKFEEDIYFVYIEGHLGPYNAFDLTAFFNSYGYYNTGFIYKNLLFIILYEPPPKHLFKINNNQLTYLYSDISPSGYYTPDEGKSIFTMYYVAGQFIWKTCYVCGEKRKTDISTNR